MNIPKIIGLAIMVLFLLFCFWALSLVLKVGLGILSIVGFFFTKVGLIFVIVALVAYMLYQRSKEKRHSSPYRYR